LAVALFDVDGTLVAGPSTEKRLFWLLLRQGWLGPGQIRAFLEFGAAHAGAGRHGWKRNKAYLAGLRCADVQALVDGWVRESAARWWFPPCVERLRQHQAAGDTVILLSGTPQFLAEALAVELGGPRAIGTLCAARAGHFLAGPPVRHPFGAAKLELAKGVCAELKVTAQDLIAYGDTVHDLDVMAFAGRAVAVRPDSGLRAAAATAGWETLGRR